MLWPSLCTHGYRIPVHDAANNPRAWPFCWTRAPPGFRLKLSSALRGGSSNPVNEQPFTNYPRSLRSLRCCLRDPLLQGCVVLAVCMCVCVSIIPGIRSRTHDTWHPWQHACDVYHCMNQVSTIQAPAPHLASHTCSMLWCMGSQGAFLDPARDREIHGRYH